MFSFSSVIKMPLCNALLCFVLKFLLFQYYSFLLYYFLEGATMVIIILYQAM